VAQLREIFITVVLEYAALTKPVAGPVSGCLA